MIKKIVFLLVLPLVLPLVLTQPLPVAAAAAPAVIKSSLDRKDYRALELDNGLKVLLVSDPAADKSAASLDVHVGNGSDPDDWQGLAHFLEHMLFLGTEKYPEAGEYKDFIDGHGGSHNAYTSFAHTNYYFDITSAHLLPALSRFSRFFIDPTFDETFVNRERAVVHSEYQARLKEEGRRAWVARRQLINPAHPASRFAVGSEHTLRDRDGVDARQKLIEFYRRHYSANLMTLAVVGRESLDQLEQWVARLFSEIPERGATVRRFEQPYLNPELTPSRLDMVPQKDAMRVSFMFPVAGTRPHYRTKPLGYVANLLGHEGEGSLLALLQLLGWAEGLSAGAGFMDEVQGTFEVSVELTEPGLRHIDEIGELLFQYIGLVNAAGVEAWRYDEERKLAEIAFRFAQEHGAGTTARALAAGLHRYPVEEVLRGPYMMEDYRPDLIIDLLARLQPDNVLLQVVSKDAKTSGKTPFYEVEFGIRPVAPATLARWSSALRDDQNRDRRLALPAANRFIPARLAAHALEKTPAVPQRLAMNGAQVDKGHVDKAQVNKGMDFWYHGDPQFGTPRAAFYFSVKSPAAVGSARDLVLTELFVRTINRQLDTVAYPAHLAGLRYQLYRHSRGFSVRISGYEDKQPAMLKVVLEALFAPRFDAPRLALLKAELKREWENAALETPSGQTVHEVYRLLLHPYWTETERLAEIDSIGIEHLKVHAARLLARVDITALSHGDITPDRARAMSRMLRSAFAGAEWAGEVAHPRARMLNDQRAYLRSMDINHGDSALVEYFQGRGKSDSERAKMALLAQLMEPLFFFNIRTTNRVGYLVHAAHLDIMEVPGLLFAVQSPTHAPARIAQLIGGFLDQFEDALARMDAQDFARVRRGLIDRVMAREQKLTERTNRYWREIDLGKFEFDSRQRLAESLESFDKDDILGYFRQVVREQPRKLVIQSPGRRQQAAARQLDGGQYTAVANAVEFRKSAQSFFPSH